MLFNSYSFLAFFPVVVVIYFLLPKKVSYLWLLAASYYFYMGWNAKYALLLFLSTTITYLSGVLIQWLKDNRPNHTGVKKWVVAGSFASNLAISGSRFRLYTRRIIIRCMYANVRWMILQRLIHSMNLKPLINYM